MKIIGLGYLNETIRRLDEMEYRIILKDNVDSLLLRDIQSNYKNDVEGISDLYDSLIENGSCDSDKVSRIYYVAYTLALSFIEIIIVKLN